MKSRMALFVAFVVLASVLAVAPAAVNIDAAQAAAHDPVAGCSFYVGDSEASVSWDPIAGVDHHIVKRSIDDGPWLWVASRGSAVGDHLDELPASGSVTGYQVLTKTDGANSTPVECEPTYYLGDVVPACTYEVAAGGVNVEWSPVAGIDSYVVERVMDGGAWEWTATFTNETKDSFVDDLAAGSIDSYRIMTKTDGVFSTATACKQFDPVAVADCSYFVGDNEVAIYWTPVAGVDHHVVKRSIEGAPWQWVVSRGANASTHLDTLPAGAIGGYQLHTKTAGVNSESRTCTRLHEADNVVPECSYAVTSQGVEVTWTTVSGTDSYVIERELANGPWEWAAAFGNPATNSFVDDVPGSPITGYRIKTKTGGEFAPSKTCYLDAPGVSPSDLGVEFDTDGNPILVGAGDLPTLIDNPPVPNASFSSDDQVPDQFENVCATGGLVSSFSTAQLAGSNRVTVAVEMEIAEGETVLFDQYRSSPEGGNYSGDIDLYRLNGDGTEQLEARVAADNLVREITVPNRTLVEGAVGGMYRLQLQVWRLTTSADLPHLHSLGNFRFVDDDNNETLVCPASELDRCIQNGGNIYFDIPVAVGGNIYEGCGVQGGCLGDAPGNWAWLQSAAVWSCENDAFLSAVQEALIMAVVVGATRNVGAGSTAATVVSGSGGRLAPYLTSLGRIGAGGVGVGGGGAASVGFAGASTAQVVAGGGAVGTVVMLGYSQVYGLPSVPDIDLSQTASSVSEIIVGSQRAAQEYYQVAGTDIATVTTTDPSTGITVLDLPSAEANLVTDSDMTVSLDAIMAGSSNSNAPNQQELRDGYRAAILRAIEVCTAWFATGSAAVALTSGIDDAGKLLIALSDFDLDESVTLDSVLRYGYYRLGSDVRHVCEGVNVYMPGSVSSLEGNKWIVQATLHQAEALGYLGNAAWTNPWPGEQPAPRPDWVFLNRGPSDDDRRWLRALDPQCRGTTANNTACDEWPWAATEQGGENPILDDRPHLRIIDASHNSSSGVELGNFYASNSVRISCGVDVGEFFMTLPLTAMLLSQTDGQPTQNLNRVESASICFNRGE